MNFGTYSKSNMYNSVVVFIFSALDGKPLLWANLVEKIKVVSLSRNLVPRLIPASTIQWQCSLFLFQTGTTLFGQIGPKTQNCQLKLRFGTYTNSNMQNAMVVFIFVLFLFLFLFFFCFFFCFTNLVQKIRIARLS